MAKTLTGKEIVYADFKIFASNRLISLVKKDKALAGKVDSLMKFYEKNKEVSAYAERAKKRNAYLEKKLEELKPEPVIAPIIKKTLKTKTNPAIINLWLWLGAGLVFIWGTVAMFLHNARLNDPAYERNQKRKKARSRKRTSLKRSRKQPLINKL
jgi:hypothetical protein